MKKYIFIPIKEHSERVPRKNFRDFCGNPLYIHALKKYENTDVNVYVDTDSSEIISEVNRRKRIYEFKNIEAYKREKALCGDDVPVNALIDYFITFFAKIEPNTWIAQIHVTHPFLKSNTVLDAMNKAVGCGGKYDSIASVNKMQTRLWREEKYGYCPVNHNPMKLEKTQDLPVFYEENSCFYIVNAFNFKNRNGSRRVGMYPLFTVVDFPENLDVDTEEDMDRCLKLSKII